jgi:DNA-binding SARP family transcriptional activator
MCTTAAPPHGSLPADTLRCAHNTAHMVIASGNNLPRCALGHAAPGSIVRERLLDQLDEVAGVRLRRVVGPAGSGKTTLLRQLAALTRARPGVLTAWVEASAADVSPPAFVHRLAAGFGALLGGTGARITRLDTLLARLAAADTEVVLFLDDAHRLAGRPSVQALYRLLADAPPNVRFVVGTRSDLVPAADRLDGRVTDYRIGYQDLRLRNWEVEKLYAELYRLPLPPDAAARLCARTEGWPAALRAFHTDTRLLGPDDRTAATAQPWARSARLRDYLGSTVLAGLPASLQGFMAEASALGILSGSLCDATFERTGSDRLLQKLADHQVLTFPANPAGTRYRFHVLLQQHLEELLAERLGPERGRELYGRAAGQLIRFGYHAEAYRAYARAEDWAATGEVLHRCRTRDSALPSLAVLPRALLEDDPWIALADARRLRAAGRLVESYRAYRLAEAGFADPRMQWQCTVERSGVARWVDPADADELDGVPDPEVADLSGQLREAMRSCPARLLARPAHRDDPGWTLVRALAAVWDGRPGLAARLLEPLTGCPDRFVSLTGQLTLGVLAALAASPALPASPASPDEPAAMARLAAVAAEAESSGWLWLARMARAATALADPACCPDALAVRRECEAAGDDWGALLAGGCHATGLLRGGADAVPALRETIARAERLDARVPETWLRLMLVHQLGGGPWTDVERDRLVRCAENAQLDHVVAGAPRFLAALRGDTPAPVHAPRAAARSAPVAIRCLGHYEFAVAGRPVDLSALRQQPRHVLRILSVHGGRPVHEESIVELLWPGVPLRQAKHRLQVAVSSLRTALRAHLPRSVPDLVARRDRAYLLRLPAGGEVDLVTFEDVVRRFRLPGPREEQAALGYRALDLYRGDLLSDEGPAEWIVWERERLRAQAAGVAASLAELELARGATQAAADVCTRGLAADELNDRLWTLLSDAHRRTGNLTAARRTESAYRTLLATP